MKSAGNNPNIMSMANDLISSLRNSSNHPFRTIYASVELTAQDVHDDVKTLARELGPEDEDPPSSPVRGQDSTLATARRISRLLEYDKLRAMMQQMAQEHAECIYTTRIQASNPNDAEVALLEKIRFGFGFANDDLKTAPFHFVEHIKVETAKNGAEDKVSDHNIERWTQSSTVQDAFTRGYLTSFRFARPVAKFIRKNLKKQSDLLDAEKNLRDNPFHFLETFPLSFS